MPRHALRLALPAALLVLALASCRRSGPPAERFVSAESEWVVVPELKRAGRELAALHETVSAFPGAAQQLAGVRSALTAQLGFDPLDPRALADAGLEPSRGAALALEPEDGRRIPVVILPVRDAAALEAFVARLARDRLGATEQVASTRGALRVVSFRQPGMPASLALALLPAERTAALSPGPTGPSLASAALSRPPAGSLAEAPAWGELRKALGERYPVLAGALGPLTGAGGAAVGVSAAAGRVQVGLVWRLGASASSAQALRGTGDSRAAIRSLSPDAGLVLRWDGDPAALGKHLVARMPPGDRAWLSAHGFEPQRDLFDVLAPGTAASVSLSPHFDLSDLSDVALRADPLRVVQLELVGEVKDEAAARASLSRLPAIFAALQQAGGITPARATLDASGGAGRVPLPTGELAWRLDGKRLAMAGGPAGSLEALAARQRGAKGYAAPTQASAAALQGGLGGAVLSPPSVVASVRGLREDAFGTGPAGFVARSIVERFLEPAERVQAISARAELTDAALVVDAQIEAPPKGAGK